MKIEKSIYDQIVSALQLGRSNKMYRRRDAVHDNREFHENIDYRL
jgi:hypothetical protein